MIPPTILINENGDEVEILDGGTNDNWSDYPAMILDESEIQQEPQNYDENGGQQ
jgi:hypothetical protein